MTSYALLYPMCNLKAAYMNVQHSLILQLMLLEFKLSHNVEEAVKILCAKGEGIVSLVIRWFKIFCSNCKNFDDQRRLGRPKSIYSKAVLQAIEANPASCTWCVSVRYHTVQYGSSPSVPQQKHPKSPTHASRYQNITKLVTDPCIITSTNWFVFNQSHNQFFEIFHIL